MASKETINIDIKSSADTAGLAKADEAVKKLTATTVTLNSRNEDLEAEFRGLSERFDATRLATYNLDEALRKTNKRVEAFHQSNTKIPGASRNTAQAMLEFSRAFEDAQYGIRGVVNNIPSLVLALGGGAGIAGAVSVAAVALSQLWTMFSDTGDKAVETGQKVDGLKDRISKVTADNMEKVAERIDTAINNVKELHQQFIETQRAEETFQRDASTRAEKAAQTQANIAKVMGAQAAAYRENEEASKRAEAQRTKEADHAIAEEQRRTQGIAEAVAHQGRILDGFKQKAETARKEIAETEARLADLMASRTTLTEQAKAPRPLSGFGGQGGNDGAEATRAFNAGQEALQRLPDINTTINSLQGRLASLQKTAVKLSTDTTGQIDKAEVALHALENDLADRQAAESKNIENIRANLDSANNLARSQDVAEASKQFATSIEQVFGNLTNLTNDQKAIVTNLRTYTTDGSIINDEMRGVSDNLRAFLGQLQSGLAGSNALVKELMPKVRALQDEQNNLRSVLNGITSRAH